MNKTEEYVAQKAIEEFRRRVDENKVTEEFLKTKKYPLNTIITKKNVSYFDNVFGVTKQAVGKIVGWDFENNYYRVYYSDKNPYVGTKEEDIDEYKGDIPESVMKYVPNNINKLYVNL